MLESSQGEYIHCGNCILYLVDTRSIIPALIFFKLLVLIIAPRPKRNFWKLYVDAFFSFKRRES